MSHSARLFCSATHTCWTFSGVRFFMILIAAAVTSISAKESARPSPPPQTDSGPALEKHTAPVYPAIAISARIQGIVIIEAVITADGRVAEARIMRSIPLLDDSARDAVRQWQFAPRADGGVVRRMITIHFVMNNPETYPRPAEYASPLTSWVPPNFAWTYRYECRDEAIAVDSIARSVVAGKTNTDRPRTVAFAFDAEDAADVFVLLVAGGFLDPEVPHRMWTERPESVAGVQDSDQGISVIVPVAAPPPPVVVSVASAQYGSSRPRRQEVHTLSVRRNDTWRVSTWAEPVSKDGTLADAAMSVLGRRLREFVRTKVEDPKQVRAC